MEPRHLQVFYAQAYPIHVLERFLTRRTEHCEVIARVDNQLEPVRHQRVADLRRLVREKQPRDGIHVAFDDSFESPFVIDVDHHGGRRAIRCSCADGGRSICDRCWLTMAGILRGYEFVFRRHFGCDHLAAAFSGGRGWHLYVLDAHNLSRRVAYEWLRTAVPTCVSRVASGLIDAQRTDGTRAYTLDAFDPRSNPSLDMMDAAWLARKVNATVLQLYRDVMLPFYRDEWVPRVLGASRTPESALTCVAQMVLGTLSRDTADGYLAASDLIARCILGGVTPPPLDKRVDAFLLVATLLWAAPDAALEADAHPIRLWWSPHQRSGNLSLPLHIARAHELRPETQPPRWHDVVTPGTTAHAWFALSLEVINDVLERDERRPRFCVGPT